METTYQSLINELKLKVHNKKFFNEILKFINNQKDDEKDYEKDDEIKKIISDENIQNLIYNIVSEQEKIGSNLEKKLNDLIWLNETLIIFGEEPQPSKTKALKLLKTKVFINIYDLEAENYEKRTTSELLRKQLKKHKSKRYPLKLAKEKPTLKCFLIKTK
jgi:DNA invertase Pin-like site-specific DNA recombinase